MRIISVILILVLAFTFLVNGDPQINKSDSIRNIQVGAIFPLDGEWASTGKDCSVALNLATDTLNDYLKADNIKITLQVENSGSDPQKALQALEKLHDEGVKIVVGPCISAEAVALMPYADNHDMVLLSPSSTAVSLARDDNLFRLALNDHHQADALAQLLQKENVTQVLIVYVDDEYGSGMNTGLKAKAADPRYGFNVTDSLSFDPKITDYSSVLQNITSAATGLDPETGAIILIGSDTHAVGIFTRAGLQSSLSRYKWFSGDGIIREAGILENDISADFAAKTRLEGFALACEDTVTIVPTMMVAGLMGAELGDAPSPAALPVWDAIWLIGETLRLDPDGDTHTFKSNLRTVSETRGNVFNEITSFDENGDIIHGKYARFMAFKDKNGKNGWKLVGMFIKNKTSGSFITDVDENQTPESGDVVIGAVLPLTGADTEMGKGIEKAINLALTHANSYYNITRGLDIHFSCDIRDSASDPLVALSQITALHQEGVDVIIMGGPSADLAAVQEYARDNNIIILSPRSTAPSLANADDFIYRLSPDDRNQAKALVRLMEQQDKQHLVVLYRDDIYGKDFQKVLSEKFNGTMDSYSYPVNQSDFSPLIAKATMAVEKYNRYPETAVVVIGLDEVTRLLETVKDGPLSSVSWYGTDGIAKSRNLVSSPEAVSVALKTNLTCSTFDVAAQHIVPIMQHVAGVYLTQAIGGSTGWNEISGYDAAWMAMNAYALTSPHADYRDLWGIINNRYGTGGIGGIYVVNDAQDQSLSSYSFYTVTGSVTRPEWSVTALYRDLMTMHDDLEIIGF